MFSLRAAHLRSRITITLRRRSHPPEITLKNGRHTKTAGSARRLRSNSDSVSACGGLFYPRGSNRQNSSARQEPFCSLPPELGLTVSCFLLRPRGPATRFTLWPEPIITPRPRQPEQSKHIPAQGNDVPDALLTNSLGGWGGGDEERRGQTAQLHNGCSVRVDGTAHPRAAGRPRRRPEAKGPRSTLSWVL